MKRFGALDHLEANNLKRKFSIFGIRVLPLPIALIAVVISLRLVGGSASDAGYVILSLYALGGRSQAIQALFFSWLITMFNPGISESGSFAPIGRFIVLFSATLSVVIRSSIWRGRLCFSPCYTFTFFICFILLAHSTILSSISDVSILKSLSFSIAFLTLLAAWERLDSEQRTQTEGIVFGGMALILIASAPFLITGVGYLRNGTGFQGILNHPQVFGPFAALLAAWLAGRFISIQKFPKSQLVLFLIAPPFIFMSESRTAGGALLLGIFFSVLLLFLLSKKKRSDIFAGVPTIRFSVSLLASLVAILFLSSTFVSSLDHYILKSGRSSGTDLRSALEASRGDLVEIMINNIKENPIAGIGFGIGSTPFLMDVQRDPIFNLPISASIEKGVMPVAIIEELGIPAGSLIYIWFFSLFRNTIRGGLPETALLATTVFINLGENIFFSFGGQGLLIMILSTWSVSGGSRKNKE